MEHPYYVLFLLFGSWLLDFIFSDGPPPDDWIPDKPGDGKRGPTIKTSRYQS